MSDYTGQLLISHPSLRDPNFHRTVLYLVLHEAEEGTLGLVLNRPLGRPLSELMPQTDLGPLAECPVFVGGPVASNQLTFVEMSWDEEKQMPTVQGNLSMDDARELYLLKGDVVRAFVGHAGWTGGQLESELESNAWLLRPPEADAFDVEHGEELWRMLIRGCGAWFELAADEPDDPTLN